MTSHFRTYANNLNRVHLAEMLDHHAQALRMAKVRPSLIANPLTGRPYGQRALTDDNGVALRHN